MSHHRHTAWEIVQTPLGPLTLLAGERGLTGLAFPGQAGALAERDRDRDALAEAASQLEAYFVGKRQAFDVPLELTGTPFQERVWRALRQVPYGATVTYTDLARRVGRPDIVRAVGGAVGRTPVPIIVPCHRVLGANGALTGYGGGLQRKQALLELERRGLEGLSPAPMSMPRQLTML